MLQNARVTAFTASELLRLNQEKGGKITFPQPRLNRVKQFQEKITNLKRTPTFESTNSSSLQDPHVNKALQDMHDNFVFTSISQGNDNVASVILIREHGLHKTNKDHATYKFVIKVIKIKYFNVIPSISNIALNCMLHRIKNNCLVFTGALSKPITSTLKLLFHHNSKIQW